MNIGFSMPEEICQRIFNARGDKSQRKVISERRGKGVREMEEELKSLSKSLGGFCNHLQSSCDAFNHSLFRRHIPLDSASSTFIKSLNRRLSTAASELNFFDSMSF